MGRFGFVERSSGIAVVFTFVCALLGFGFAFQAKAESVATASPDISMGSLAVFTSMNSDGLTTLKVLCGKLDLTQDKGNAYRQVTYDDPLDSFPSENMDTIKVNIYTGGANCCQGYYLLSAEVVQGTQYYAAYIEPYDGGLIMNSEPAGYAAIDPGFKGYEIEGTDVFLNRAESPRLSRLLVFDKGQWRVDKLGEFTDYYRDIEKEAAEIINPLSRAIALSYYHLMADSPMEEVRGILQQAMPKELADEPEIVDRILVDIEKAAKGFNPVKNLKIYE